MEFDNFFNASMGETDLSQQSVSQEIFDCATISTDAVQAQYPHKNYYPTPNSTNMHAHESEKTFMSPFPSTFHQKFPSINSDAPFSDFDELLFTPMLSPAMTPMHNAVQQAAEVDWENFDENLFALTAPAIDNANGQLPDGLGPNLHATKKQRISANSARSSHHTSPRTPHSFSSRRGNVSGYHKKDNTSMAAPAVPAHAGSSTDSNEAVSPVELDHFHSLAAVVPAGGLPARTGQPITPSMLMSLQSSASINGSGVNPSVMSQGLSLDLGELPGFTTSPELQSLATPPPQTTSQSPAGILPGTPRSTGILPVSGHHITRDIKPRPIAPAHSRSKSVCSSPALNPQCYKASPELRPILPGGMSPQVGAMLASKSNYQHIVDGTYDQLNISYPQGMTHGLEVRRTSHKAAEQKRRDHLKDCFELMRTILPDRPEAGASKVAILKKGYEHILQLHSTLEDKDAEIARLKSAAATPNVDPSPKA